MQQISHPSPRPAHLVSAFSLIELIIVILIASLFAGLVFSQIASSKPKEKKVGIRMLKKAVTQLAGTEADLVCTDECRQCRVITEGKGSEIGSQLKPLKAYILDDGGSPKEIDFGRMDDRKICLRFHYYSNGSTSQMILESEEKFYFVPSYFGEVETFDSLSAATDRWRRYRDQLDTLGTYF